MTLASLHRQQRAIGVGGPVTARTARSATALLLALLCPCTLAVAAAQTAPEPPPAIAVEGQASGNLRPDAAHLAVGVEVDRLSAAAATDEVSRAMAAVMDAIRSAGIADKDVQTTAVGLVPVYPDDAVPPAGQPRLPRSYLASVRITLVVRPPERAGAILALLVDKGVTTIDGITFSAAGDEQLRDSLRGDAVRDARRKADLYVQALGLHLGTVMEIIPEEGSAPPPVAFARAATSILASPSPPIPVAPGSIHLREAVRVRWTIAP